MKKIININLSGRVIPIEDSAYEKLQNYIESLRRYFANEEGRDEIINDIESRIAELMNDKVRKGATCVIDADVDEIIASMGTTADFDAADAAAEANDSAQQKASTDQQSFTQKKSRGRLYRDSSDKFIAGVCSGIAAYMNIDPAIVRILFAIITFGGFGLGFLLYILLWIFVPTKDLEGFAGKRLYRNPEDKIAGGVAGGLAAYLNRDAWTVRLIFAIPLIISIFFGILKGFTADHDPHFFPNLFFGSITSTFILIYIILWMILPEANTTYEKMEMRGEKVDVNRIRQNVQDGMGNVKDRMKNWTEEVKQSAQEFGSRAKDFANTRGKAFASEVGDTARRSGHGIGHAIGVLFKVFFLFIAGTIAFALFVGLMALLFGGIAWWPVNNFLWTSSWQQAYAWGTLIFFIGVPLIGFITWLVRRIIRVRSRNSYLGWTFGALWTIGWVAAVLFASSVSSDFREYEHRDTTITLAQPVMNRMLVAVSEPALEYNGRFAWMNDGGDGWDLSDDTLKLSAVRLDVQRSIDDAYHVIVRKYSYGKTDQDAFNRADHIQYAVQSRDSVLDLGNGYAIGKANKFRLQAVEIEIQVPVGKKIRFDASVVEKLNPWSLRLRRHRHSRTVVNGEVVYQYDNEENIFRFQTDVDYMMTTDGLKDANGHALQGNDDYRYSDDASDSSSIRQQLEEKRRNLEDLQKSIKDLQEKQKQAPPATHPAAELDQKKIDRPGEAKDDQEEGFSTLSPANFLLANSI